MPFELLVITSLTTIKWALEFGEATTSVLASPGVVFVYTLNEPVASGERPKDVSGANTPISTESTTLESVFISLSELAAVEDNPHDGVRRRPHDEGVLRGKGFGVEVFRVVERARVIGISGCPEDVERHTS